jgi:YVTN family beta-propeller protein
MPFNPVSALTRCVALATALSVPAVAATPPSDSGMAVGQRWTLGGPGGWDYLSLDAAGDRLFVSRGVRVDVLSTQTGKIIGSIANTEGVHGIALAEGLRRGYTSNGRADSVTAFDLDSLQPLQEMKIPGHNPDAILYEPVGKHVFTFNGRSKDITILDATTLQILATLPVPDKPEFAVTDGKGRIYVNIESDPGQMVMVDGGTLSIAATWPLPGCSSPSGLAIDAAHHRLFSVCAGKTMVITDAQTGMQIARAAIGEGPDAAAFDARRGLVFSSNGEGNVSVIEQTTPDRYQSKRSVVTERGARTMALDPATGKIYLATADFGVPPPASAEQPHPRPPPIADTFRILVVGPH